ncbi:hypothetical protein BH23BAC1_BH23BAC1_20110 [soil metagenome]
MRPLIFLLVTLILNFPVKTFSQSIDKQLRERQELLDQLSEVESQKSSIFGKKSKKDLRNSTEILNDIVVLDTELIKSAQAIIANKEAETLNSEENVNTQTFLELEKEIAQLNEQSIQRQQKAAELEQEIVLVKDRMFKYQSTILICFFIIFLLAVYISRLKKKVQLQKQAL